MLIGLSLRKYRRVSQPRSPIARTIKSTEFLAFQLGRVSAPYGEEAKLPSEPLWRCKSRNRGPGRPGTSIEIRKLIVEMAEMNVGWGAPRIHGELLKLGIAVNERQLRRVIRSYVDYYHEDRTHLGVEKDSPEERSVESRETGEVVVLGDFVSSPRVGGLHHRYSRELRNAA